MAMGNGAENELGAMRRKLKKLRQRLNKLLNTLPKKPDKLRTSTQKPKLQRRPPKVEREGLVRLGGATIIIMRRNEALTYAQFEEARLRFSNDPSIKAGNAQAPQHNVVPQRRYVFWTDGSLICCGGDWRGIVFGSASVVWKPTVVSLVLHITHGSG